MQLDFLLLTLLNVELHLSHNLAGIFLSYDHFGNHLHFSGKTIERETEEKNFQKAAEVVSEVSEKTVVDEHSVNFRAVSVGSLYKPTTLDPVWVVKPCQQISILFTNCEMPRSIVLFVF